MVTGLLLVTIFVTGTQPVDWNQKWSAIVVFAALVALGDVLDLASSPWENGLVHIFGLTALLALGPVPALWVVVLGGTLGEILSRILARLDRIGFSSPRSSGLFVAGSIAVNGISVYAAGVIYEAVSNGFGTTDWTARDILALVPLFGAYFLINRALGAALLWAAGSSVTEYFRWNLWSTLTRLLLPLPLAAILAAIYLDLGTLLFIIAGVLFIGIWVLFRRLRAMRRDLEKRLRELRTLNKVGQTIATSLELDVLLNTIYHQVSQLMDAGHFYIALYDAVGDVLTFPLVFENGERKRYSGRRARNGLTEYVIRECRPILIQDQTEHIVANLGLEVIGQPALSWLGVPLVVGDKVLGVITVQSFTRPYAYDEKDMALLSTLAVQAAIALENAQLYGQMRRRTAELALLNTVSTAVSSTLDLDQVLQIVVTSIMPIIVCQKAALFLWDSPGGELRLAASQGLSDQFEQTSGWRDDAHFRRLRNQNAIIVPDINTSGSSADEIELAVREGYRAFAEIALMTQQEMIGSLCVFYDQVHHFDLAERDLLTTFANQAATAIANARLYSRTDQALARRVEELSAIERIGRELTSTLEPQRVLDLVLEQAMRGTSASRGCIAMLDSVQNAIKIVSHRGYSTEMARQLLSVPSQLEEGIVGRVLRKRQMIFLPDLGQDSAYAASAPEVRAQLAVPIFRDGTDVGAICLESTQETGFDEQDADFVSQLSTQAAVALKNAQLFQERSERVEELSLLYQASLSLASSLDYTDVLDTIGRLARHITNSDTVTFYLYDAINDVFERASSEGYEAAGDEFRGPRSSGITRAIIETRRPVLVSDTLTYPEINPRVIERGVRTVIGVPVISRGEVLGVLYVNRREPNVYTDNDVRLVSALANQAGATIANVRLFSQVSEARDRLEAIINSTQEGILVLDNSGRVVTANSRLGFFLDLQREQLAGLTINELLEHHRDAMVNLFGLTLTELDGWISRLLPDSTETYRRTLQIPAGGSAGAASTSSSSRRRFTELFVTPVLDTAGQAIGRLLVFRDITEEKELERMRDDLTGMMVHDLRSPLTAVLSGLDILRELAVDEHTDPMGIQALDVAGRSCHQMLTMVNNLLDISRLESGKMPLECGPAPFSPLVHGVVFRLSPIAAERDVQVEVDISSDLPMVNIDNEQISRVVTNLLDNALKFTPAGKTVIISATHPDSQDGDFLLCSVSDAGFGIPAGYEETIFDRFSQVRGQTSSSRQRGSGLGLAFCKLAIEAHGGRIWAQSSPGQGSTFYFTLPVADVASWLTD
jgi:NtrC-family two-component system sensor histidine kinase KinB